MRFNVFRVFLITSLLVVFGCSDQPKQVPNRDAVVLNPAAPALPKQDGVLPSNTEETDGFLIIDHVIGREPTEVRVPRVVDGNPEDEKIEQNGKQPIIFNGESPLESSVAGVKFNTPFEEAGEILSTPYLEGCGTAGDYYLENLCFLWSEEEPRRLRQALILDGYLGEISLPFPFGKVTMKSEFQDVFKPEFGELGEVLLQRTYNQFFNKEETFNCVATKDCQALLYNDYINWILPNLTIVFSKDRKVLVQMVINQDVQPGDFASPLDLVLGGINVDSTGKMLMLGETWGEVQKKLSTPANPPGILEAQAFRKDFVGSVARVQRAGVYGQEDDFSLEAKDASENEIFHSFLVYSNYQEPIMLNGKFLVLSKNHNSDRYNLDLVDSKPRNDEESRALNNSDRGTAFTVRMDILAGDVKAQKQVLRSLAGLIKSEFKTKYPNSIVAQRFSGFHAKPAANRRMILRTSFYDFDAKKGLFVYTHVSVNSGSFLFSVALDNNPLSNEAMLSAKNAIDLSTQKLSGVRLGERVKLTNIDRSRNEGFLTIGDHTTRVELDLYASANVSYERDLVSRQNIIEVSSGVSGVLLGLSSLSPIDQNTTELEAEVTYLSSSLNAKGIMNVCGSDEVFEIGMTQQNFERKLRNIVKQKAKENNKQTCFPFVSPDVAGDSEARVVYFPTQQTRIFFSERVLTGVSKYKKASGGNQ